MWPPTNWQWENPARPRHGNQKRRWGGKSIEEILEVMAEHDEPMPRMRGFDEDVLWHVRLKPPVSRALGEWQAEMPGGKRLPDDATNEVRNAAPTRESGHHKVRRGRPRKTKDDSVDKVVAKIIRRGEHEPRKWKELRAKYDDKLPKRITADALRKRIQRALDRNDVDNK